MQNLLLPSDTAFYDQRVELDGVTYILSFTWNARGGTNGTWTLSISDAAQTPIVSGITIVSDVLLLRRYKYLGTLPLGDLMAVDLTKTIDAPGYSDLGTLVPLYYITG